MPIDATATIRDIIASPEFQHASAVIAAEHDRMVEDLIRLTEIEAPSFNEHVRAQAWMEMARAHGLEDVAMDDEGIARTASSPSRSVSAESGPCLRSMPAG